MAPTLLVIIQPIQHRDSDPLIRARVHPVAGQAHGRPLGQAAVDEAAHYVRSASSLASTWINSAAIDASALSFRSNADRSMRTLYR